MTSSEPRPEATSALLHESAEELYEHAPCGYVSTDPAGLVLRVNATLLGWLGYERADLVGRRRLQDLFSAGGRIYNETHIAPLLRMQGSVQGIAVDVVRADGRLLPVLLASIMKRDERGEPVLVRTTLLDASSRRDYERELVRARKKAEAADRAKAEFISLMSHEIRTPLNAIMGVGQLLGLTTLDASQKDIVRILRSSGENLLHLVNEVLDFSRIESGGITLEERRLDLKKMAGDVVASLRVKADEKGIGLELRADDGVPQEVLGDPVKLRQVLTNLVGNAIKFTSMGGVTLTLQNRGQAGTRSVVRFAVTDTGIGIEADKLGAIFENFTQASYDIGMKYGGTGLGLAISRKLVELHGSRLQVESEVGRGSTFFFDVPFEPCRTAADAEAPGAAERNALRGLKALVADDNQVNVFVLTGLLREWGVAFEATSSGHDTVARVKEDVFDVVLMDIRMPDLDGFAATRQIRALPGPRFATLPIVAVSASIRMGQAHEIEEAGLSAFVGKPVNPDALYATLVRVTGR